MLISKVNSSTSNPITTYLFFLVLFFTSYELQSQQNSYFSLRKVYYLNKNKDNTVLISGNLVLAKRTMSSEVTFYENDNFFRGEFSNSSDSFTKHTLGLTMGTNNTLSVRDDKWKKYIDQIYFKRKKMVLVLKNKVTYVFIRKPIKSRVVNVSRDSMKFLYLVNPNSILDAGTLGKPKDTFFKVYTVLRRGASLSRGIKKPARVKGYNKKATSKKHYFLTQVNIDTTGKQSVKSLITSHTNKKNRTTRFAIAGNQKLLNGALLSNRINSDEIKKIKYFDNVSFGAILFTFSMLGAAGMFVMFGAVSALLGDSSESLWYLQAAAIMSAVSPVFLPFMKFSYRIKNAKNASKPFAWTLGTKKRF